MRPIIFIILLNFSFISCSGVPFLPWKANNYFTKSETIVFEKTVLSLGYDYGYDSSLEINYIFAYSKENSVFINKNKKDFNITLNKMKDEELLVFSKKIYSLFYTTEYLKSHYFKKKDWTRYNHINDELLAPLTTYHKKIESYLKTKRSDLYFKISKDKETLKKEAIMIIHDKLVIVDEYQ